jgi:hypothetical protein
MTFDPASDAATSPRRAKIKDTYETLQERDEGERAEELRAAESLRQQLRIVDDVQEFDPKHDDAKNATRLRVQRVYESLRAAGDDDLAADLRQLDTVAEQAERARELAARLGEGGR